MLVYRIEHNLWCIGKFQRNALSIRLSVELFELYNNEIFKKIIRHEGIEDNVPRKEATRCNLLCAYYDFINKKLIKFGCPSKESLFNNWCIKTSEYLDALNKCGFVLSVYECTDYFELPSQIIYDIETSVLISKGSVFELLT